MDSSELPTSHQGTQAAAATSAKLTPAQIAEAQRLAREWKAKWLCHLIGPGGPSEVIRSRFGHRTQPRFGWGSRRRVALIIIESIQRRACPRTKDAAKLPNMTNLEAQSFNESARYALMMAEQLQEQAVRDDLLKLVRVWLAAARDAQYTSDTWA